MDYPQSRAEAFALNAKYYFTGKPCKHGHVALRKTKGACLECLKIESKEAYRKRYDYFVAYNQTKGIENKKRYYQKNKEKIIEKNKKVPIETIRKYKKAWKKANPEEVKAATNDRRRRHKDATPKWLSVEQKAEIRKIYKRAIQFCKDKPKAYAVDHIVPLMGKEVCGLHVPWNLQILSAEENFKKNNKLLDTHPKEG
jgi:hypothetical protein